MIHEQQFVRGPVTLHEYRRDGVPTVYLLLPSQAANCAGIKNEDRRWKCIKVSRFAQRKLREGEDTVTLYAKKTLDDGSKVIVDNHGDSSIPEEEFVLRPGQWEQIQALPHDQQRAKLNELVEANKNVDPAQVRTEADEQARETYANATTGEAHQEAERQQ